MSAVYPLICFAGLAQFPAPTNFGQVVVNGGAPAIRTIAIGLSGLSGQPTFTLSYGIDFSAAPASCNAQFTDCTVAVTFNPGYAGNRGDAIVVKDGTGSFVGTATVYGTGLGPQLAFVPGVISVLPFSKLDPDISPAGFAADPAGNIYVADSYGSFIGMLSPGS